MSLKSARLSSLREKLEAKELDKNVEEVLETLEDGEEPKARKLKVKPLKAK